MKLRYLLALTACAAGTIATAPAQASRSADFAAAIQPKAEAGFESPHAQQLALNPQPEPPKKKAKKGRVPGPQKLNPQPEPPASKPMTVQPPPNPPK